MLTRSQKLAYTFGVWMLAVLSLLVLFNSLSFEYFFVLSLIGFLALVELAGPFTVRPAWRSRVTVVIVIAVILFAAIVAEKVLGILGISLFT